MQEVALVRVHITARATVAEVAWETVMALARVDVMMHAQEIVSTVVASGVKVVAMVAVVELATVYVMTVAKEIVMVGAKHPT